MGTVCREDAERLGLTVLDLSERWVPPMLATRPDGYEPRYQKTYLALANERFRDAHTESLARRDRYFEMYGIAPSFSVVRERLADVARHQCHEEVDDEALWSAPDKLALESAGEAREREREVKKLRARLDAPQVATELDVEAHTELAALEAHGAAIRAVQAHLACDELFTSEPVAGAYTAPTSRAVRAFQRGAMLLPTGVVDEHTRMQLLADSRERDFRTALRVLRERVIATTGLIEDGTAGTGMELVLGRELEPPEVWRVDGHDLPLPGAAPDLVSRATEAAAIALGWRDPDATLAFLDSIAELPAEAQLVAVRLPPPPSYHADHMELQAEIDRGDVWLDDSPTKRKLERRPALIVYAVHDGERIPLVRWPTTIGGWQDEKVDGKVVKRYKGSPAGPRVWRDVFVGPSWLPPSSTPDGELVRRRGDGGVLAREQLGPSYRGAFGVVSFVHLNAVPRDEGYVYRDEGIRTHATGNLVSLDYGASHGCHRLLGMHAVRLANFVLDHREHVHHGDTPTRYRRTVHHRGTHRIAIDSLGDRTELVPPIPVDVLPGTIHKP